MKVYKALSFVLHLLMLFLWILSALLFLNLALNYEFKLYIQKLFFYSESNMFLVLGISISCVCVALALLLYRQNRTHSLFIFSKNEKTQLCSSFMKDLVEFFFKKHGIGFQELEVVLHKQRLKIFVRSKTTCLKALNQFESDLSNALTHQIGYTKPFKIAFELFEN